ncbi:MAG: murein biosynthesis integral membrane protein MurJ [Clostridiales bacterium]|nr:murein biosynthesis integral membrane protein MurJ [Clostridiales bacterium]
MSESLHKTSLSQAVMIVMSSIIVSRITGYIREMLIPAKFGVNDISDAYNLGFLVPDLMFSLLVGGAISAAVVPVLSGYLGTNREQEGWAAFSSFVNLLGVFMVLFCTLGIIFAPELVKIVAAGYGEKQPEKLELVVRITRILFPTNIFLMLAGLCNGVLNSYRKFAAAAYGPSIYNISCALSIFFLSSNSPADDYGVIRVAYGVLAGSIVYFLFQLSFAVRHAKFFKLGIIFVNEGFRKLFRLAIPSLASSTIMQINIIINARFASFFEMGSVTALRMADRSWQMPLGIVAQGLATAILPSISSDHAKGDTDTYKGTLMKGLKTALLLTVPSAVGFAVLGPQIIRTMYRFSDKMTEADVTLTAGILLFYSIALITQSMSTILNRGFFAINNTKTTLNVGLFTIIVNIILSIVFYNFTSLGVAGMALAYSIASFVNAISLLLLLNSKVKGLDLRGLGGLLVKIVPVAAISGFFMFGLSRLLPSGADSIEINLMIKINQIIFLLIELTVGILIYFILVLFLKVDEALLIKEFFLKKLKKLK